MLDSSMEELIKEFRVTHNQFPQWLPRWNIAPTSHIPIVLEGPEGARSIAPARWSLIPSWSTELTVPYATFNARSETAGQKPTFRGPLEHTRCLIPASGYYEWSEVGEKKLPNFVYRPALPLLAIAGLYSWWKGDGDESPLATATILTRASEGPLRAVHDRMPVLVTKEDWTSWLNPGHTDGAALLGKMSASSAARADEFSHYRVAPLEGEGSELIQPLTKVSKGTLAR
ncbi:MAG: putative SOS response-associated peptidase YedK [Pontimonas sp.]